MDCWNCGKNINDSHTAQINYCSYCGMMLKEKCVYCGRDLSTVNRECDFCDNPFSFCTTCNVFYKLSEEKCVECGQALQNECVITLSNEVNYERTNAYSLTVPAGISIAETKSVDKEISVMCSINSKLYFWKNVDGKCRLTGINLRRGDLIWKETDTALRNMKLDRDLNLEIYHSYIFTCTSDTIIINDIITGADIASITLDCSDYQAIIHGKDLFIISSRADEQRVVVYSDFKEYREIYFEHIIPKSGYQCAAPVIYGNFIYFAGFDGVIYSYDVTNKAFKTLYDISDMDKQLIYQLAVYNDQLYALYFKNDNKYILKEISLIEYNNETIQDNLNLAVPKFSIFNDRLLLCERVGDRVQFNLYNINTHMWRANPSIPISANTSVKSFYVVVEKDKQFIVYVAITERPNFYTVNVANISTMTTTKIKTVSINSNPAILNVYNYIVTCERSSGKIYFNDLHRIDTTS